MPGCMYAIRDFSDSMDNIGLLIFKCNKIRPHIVYLNYCYIPTVGALRFAISWLPRPREMCNVLK